jgi:hypothetical protein
MLPGRILMGADDGKVAGVAEAAMLVSGGA